MKPTIILLAPPALAAFWRETITSGDGALLSGDLVFDTDSPKAAGEQVAGKGAGQLAVVPADAYSPLSLDLVRTQCPSLAFALVEKSTGEKVKREVFFDAPPHAPKPHRSPGAIRSVTIPSFVREEDDWTEGFRDLFEYAVVQDMSSGTGTSLYGAVERFLTSLLAPTPDERRERRPRLQTADLLHGCQAPA